MPPSERTHTYPVQVRWTGNLGTGTSGYGDYARAHEISAGDKPTLPGSSDPSFRGDPARYNPEELLVASLSACHMLWYLHLCADAGLVVSTYADEALGTLVEGVGIPGRFQDVVLRPRVGLAHGDAETARALHERAHALCFIANSVDFEVRCEPRIVAAGDAGAC